MTNLHTSELITLLASAGLGTVAGSVVTELIRARATRKSGDAEYFAALNEAGEKITTRLMAMNNTLSRENARLRTTLSCVERLLIELDDDIDGVPVRWHATLREAITRTRAVL